MWISRLTPARGSVLESALGEKGNLALIMGRNAEGAWRGQDSGRKRERGKNDPVDAEQDFLFKIVLGEQNE